MDSGAAPRRSRRLERLMPSTSRPPLGERPRQDRKACCVCRHAIRAY